MKKIIIGKSKTFLFSIDDFFHFFLLFKSNSINYHINVVLMAKKYVDWYITHIKFKHQCGWRWILVGIDWFINNDFDHFIWLLLVFHKCFNLSETNADICVTFICTQFNDISNLLIRKHSNKALEAYSSPSKHSDFSTSS